MIETVFGILFVIGLFSVIALLFTIRSELRAQERLRQHRALSMKGGQVAVPTVAEESASSELTLAGADDKESMSSTGQLIALSRDLLDLHQQTQELELRLGALANIVGKLPRSSSGRTTVEEVPDSSSSSEAASTS